MDYRVKDDLLVLRPRYFSFCIFQVIRSWRTCQYRVLTDILLIFRLKSTFHGAVSLYSLSDVGWTHIFSVMGDIYLWVNQHFFMLAHFQVWKGTYSPQSATDRTLVIFFFGIFRAKNMFSLLGVFKAIFDWSSVCNGGEIVNFDIFHGIFQS